jgi:hypothetical protein
VYIKCQLLTLRPIDLSGHESLELLETIEDSSQLYSADLS